MKVVNFMAKACHYAQEHYAQEYIGDPDAWGELKQNRENYFTCVSYQMACFFAENTVNGENDGVDCNIVMEELINTKRLKGMMIKSVKEWKTILQDIADDLGGWRYSVLISS